jgi:ABC-type uncharacterized transport system substrate-binding protein
VAELARHSPRRRLKACLAAALAATFAHSAAAHPHVWIVVETTVLYDKGAFTGLRHDWTFDEFYTQMAIEGLDKNHDGIYDREELSELAKVNIDGLKEFSYFTYPMHADKAIKFEDARDYWLEHKNGLLVLHFTLPFAKPVAATGANFTFQVEDPTYFIAFSPAKDNPYRLGAGAPKSCKLTVAPQDEAPEAALAKAFAQVFPNVSASGAVAVVCNAP